MMALMGAIGLVVAFCVTLILVLARADRGVE